MESASEPGPDTTSSFVFIEVPVTPLIPRHLCPAPCEFSCQFTRTRYTPGSDGAASLGNCLRCQFKNRCTVPSAIRVGQSTEIRSLALTLSANPFCPNGYSWYLK